MPRLAATLLRPLRPAAALILLYALPQAGARELRSADEYEIKARVLQIIGSYVIWPPAPPADPGHPFVIGVLGESPFGRFLDEACRNKAVQSRKIKVVYLEQVRHPALGECNILFICASEAGRLASVLAACKGKPIFLVGDTPNFARRGVMINLQVVAGTLALEVNLKAARAADMEISPTFLALSKDKTRLIESE